jgi:3-hydroxyisobutyrate dehydrogenase
VDKTKQLAESATTKQVIWIDSPVSGGTAGAENGTLVIFAGGNAETIQALSLFIISFTTCHTHG